MLPQAKAKVAAKGWQNVHVVEADACTFTPPGETATLVTFSYSLSSARSRSILAPSRAPAMHPALPRKPVLIRAWRPRFTLRGRIKRGLQT